jgi:hypothetical protein
MRGSALRNTFATPLAVPTFPVHNETRSGINRAWEAMFLKRMSLALTQVRLIRLWARDLTEAIRFISDLRRFAITAIKLNPKKENAS